MSFISQAKIKVVRSLIHKKYREKHGLYMVQGLKACQTAIDAGYYPEYTIQIEGAPLIFQMLPHYAITQKEIAGISPLSSVPDIIGIFPLPPKREFSMDIRQENVILYLDRIQDPGNIGTIIRTADWYGVKTILVNEGCADPYHIKVLQAAKGSHFNVNWIELHFDKLVAHLPLHQLVGLDANGSDLNEKSIQSNQIILVIGNEGQGLAQKIRSQVHILVCLPGHQNRMAESLNAAIATGISLDRLMNMSIR